MTERQTTWQDVAALHYLRVSNPTVKRIVKLIATGDHTQSQTARILGVTPQYVNQIVKKFRSFGLLKQSPKTPGRYNKWFEASPLLKRKIEENTPEITLTACRVHHIRLKYHYSADRPLALDNDRDHNRPSRTFYTRSWIPRGGARHKFTVPGKPGTPDIVIDVHPHTLVAYPCSGHQDVVAATVEEAETRIKTAIHEAVLSWVGKQRLFNVAVALADPSHVGRQVSPTHYGFAVSPATAAAAGEQTHISDLFIDHSPEAHGQPFAEVETLNPATASALDRGLKAVLEWGNGTPSQAQAAPASVPAAVTAALDDLRHGIEQVQQAQNNTLAFYSQLKSLTEICATLVRRQGEMEAALSASTPRVGWKGVLS